MKMFEIFNTIDNGGEMVNRYSFKTGLGKTIKNWLVTWGVPIILVLFNNWTEWLPTKYTVTVAPILGALAYFVKNYVQNK